MMDSIDLRFEISEDSQELFFFTFLFQGCANLFF